MLKDKKMTPKQLGRQFVHWVFEHVYPDVDIKQLSAKEALLVAESTMQLTDTVRENELKNLTSYLIGSPSEQTTAKTAEK